MSVNTVLNSPQTVQPKTRSERVALKSSSQSFFAKIFGDIRRNGTGTFFLIICIASIAISVIVRAWNPPFEFRINNVTSRAIVCNTDFSVPSPEGKRLAVERARLSSMHVFVNDPSITVQLRDSLWNTIATFVNADSYEKLNAAEKDTWNAFLRPNGKGEIPQGTDPKTAFETFLTVFRDGTNLDLFNKRLRQAFTPFELHGTLRALNFGAEQGSQEQILVYRKGETPDRAVPFKVSEILIRDGSRLRESLQRELNNPTLVEQLFNWIYPKWEITLTEDRNATADVWKKAEDAVGDVRTKYISGQILVKNNEILNLPKILLLEAEYDAFLAKREKGQQVLRFHSVCLAILILFTIAWGFVRRMERRRPKTPFAFAGFMTSIVLTVAAAEFFRGFPLTGAEWAILPLLLFAMSVSITYSWELALTFSILLSLFLAFASSGGGENLLILLLGTSVSTVIQLGRLRSRKKLVLVSCNAGIVTFLLTIVVGIYAARPFEAPLLLDAVINAVWSLLAGLIMTGLLPFIEGPFGILTDMSLLELGDISHPLLQSLIRLAPATYGHSLQVSTIAETAAEAIGARGLLLRVGAYFHDIGKIMKPEYFSENQGGIENIHDRIEPQISTIVVIAHVKDGIDLAKQHHLPQPVIDLIEQHHGTSLVSFFYGRAKTGNKDEAQPVEESTFRYPGPKPQSKEAAILMIADTCESACRSMGTAATPGKIENKVHILIKQKLDDGQFDDSGLTLRELKIIENSVIKSIIAAMHGRIRYPGQDDQENAKVVAKPEGVAETPQSKAG